MVESIPDDIDVEEQYTDILEIIESILPHFEGHDVDNHNPVGRLKGELLYIQQEVEAKRFAIPNNEASVSTCYSLAGEPMFPKGFPRLKEELYAIVAAVVCQGLVKTRHFPRLIEMIDGVIVEIDVILKTEKTLLDETHDHLILVRKEYIKLGQKLHKSDGFTLPLDKKVWPEICNIIPRLKIRRKYEALYNLDNQLSGILSSRWRPRQSQPTPGWIMPDWVKENGETS